MADTPKEVIEKTQRLLALAQGGDENSEEARTAAYKATLMIKEHDLMLVPRSEVKRVERVIGEQAALARKFEGEAKQKMMLGAFAGFLLAGGGKGLGLKF